MKYSLKKLIQHFLPEQTRIVQHGHSEPPVQLHMVDVDRLHSALRSAEGGETTELFSLYRDIIGSHSHLQSEFNKRKLAVLGDQFNVTAVDPEDEDQVKHAADIKSHLESLPDWIQVLAHMLDSTLYPVSVTDRLYKASKLPGWRVGIKELTQIKHHHLSWPDGVFSLELTDESGYQTGQYEPLCKDRYIIHRGHLLTSLPDWHGGPMRALIFWWLFSVSSRDWWARFLERFGSPFLEGRYTTGDDGARFELQNAFSEAQRVFGIVVNSEAVIKMHQANSAQGGDAFLAFQSAANKEMSKVVIGQTLSADGQNLGLGGGGGQAEAQSQVRDDIRQFDAVMLCHTIKTKILAPLWQANGWTMPMPSISFGGESVKEQTVTGTLLGALAEGGLRITDDGIINLSKKIGLSIERDPNQQSIPFSALSANNEFKEKDHMLPTVRRRAERKRLARRATEEVIKSASPQLAKAMTADFQKFTDAIEESTSPQDCLDRLSVLTATYDPTEAGLIIKHTLTTASANALIASDHAH